MISGGVRRRAARHVAATPPMPPPHDAVGEPAGGEPRLARPLEIERTWVPDREVMAAALRVVLDLPRVVPGSREGGER